MIVSKITAKAQTTIPRAVREALGVGAGDSVVYDIGEGVVTLRRVVSDDPFDNPFAPFTEWADELDAAYDAL